jgi:hypothetical protein
MKRLSERLTRRLIHRQRIQPPVSTCQFGRRCRVFNPLTVGVPVRVDFPFEPLRQGLEPIRRSLRKEARVRPVDIQILVFNGNQFRILFGALRALQRGAASPRHPEHAK